MRSRWLFLSLLALVGCKKTSDLKFTESVTEVFQQVPSNKVDILWVLDSSVSMVEEQARVQNGAADFIDHLDTTGMDFHLGVITTDVEAADADALIGSPAYLTADDPDYVESFKSRVNVGTDGEQMESGLEAAVRAVTSPLVDGANAGFLREDARLSVIVVSDEDDCSDFGAMASGDNFDCYQDGAPLTAVADIVDMLRDAKGIDAHSSLLQLSGIIGPPVASDCPSATPGDRYQQAIDEVGGLDANICEADYGGIMDSLGLVASGVQSVFNLAHVADPASIQVTVTDGDGTSHDVAESATEGWVYASGTNVSRLTFYGDGVPERGSTFSVTYDIAQESATSYEGM